MKDVLTSSLADDTGILANQAYRPVVLYINGAYWGIHYIREKINEGFIAANANVSEDSVNLLVANGRVGAGSEDYQALLSYIKAHSPLNAEAYRYVCDRMDVTSFADYLITEMVCGNKDSGNIRWYRSSETDNKWRWILYDTDITYAAGENWVWFLIDPAGTGTGQNFSTALINGLLTNGEFRAAVLGTAEVQHAEHLPHRQGDGPHRRTEREAQAGNRPQLCPVGNQPRLERDGSRDPLVRRKAAGDPQAGVPGRAGGREISIYGAAAG